ncbi:NADPH:quinone oxidoreductase family protein [Alkalihalobacillus oceani]|uniref:quinone oxidoreductase family protein n=1 Tax=Halalkalibacter oceani TaxID=1653776 RepID=UPI0020424907|nr:NADPH:quinone oxidoreductase family protein [Halalkalibacter oceani]MCM3762709.1 NADPH:quinone oxidoreductase family protein [Halalkalibacter oceani]
MKAVVVAEHGGPDVLRIEDREIPEISATEVLIKVEAISVNFADIKARVGEYHGQTGFPFTPGLDCAGVIVKAGEEVRDLKEGQRVMAFPKGGSYAEYVCADPVLTYALPDELDSETAAASLTVGVTAYNVLKKMAGLMKGESILIHASAGGIGTTAVQLAKLFGAATIIGTVGSDEKKQLVESLGADHVINYREQNFVDEVMKLTKEEGVDVILDTVAGDNFNRSMECLSHFGRIVNFGHANDGSHPGEVKTNALHSSCRTVIGYSTGTYRKRRPAFLRDSAEQLIQLLVGGKLQMQISERFPLAEAGQAQAHVESRKSTGKILLIP